MPTEQPAQLMNELYPALWGSSAEAALSLPARGAWIEIRLLRARAEPREKNAELRKERGELRVRCSGMSCVCAAVERALGDDSGRGCTVDDLAEALEVRLMPEGPGGGVSNASSHVPSDGDSWGQWFEDYDIGSSLDYCNKRGIHLPSVAFCFSARDSDLKRRAKRLAGAE